MSECQFQEGGLGRRIDWEMGKLRGQLALGRELVQTFWYKFGGGSFPVADLISLGCFTVIHCEIF